jgi:hypothetical protein
MRYKTWNRVEDIIASTVFGIIPVVYFILFVGVTCNVCYRPI